MLDLTLPTPRHLCCRPILVEQSAFVSSGFTLPTAMRRDPSSNNNESAAANNNTVNAEQLQHHHHQHINILQPTAPLAIGDDQHHHILDSVGFIGFPPEELSAAGGTQSNNNDRQMEISQLIRAVVNSVPLHTDVRVEISRRNDGTSTTTTNTQTSSTGSTAAATVADDGTQSSSSTTSDSSTSMSSTDSGGATTNSSNGGGGGGLSQPRVTTATHPTTATQTRSTARPQSQIQLTGLPVGPLRTLRPVSGQTSFDRFLPCSSHHVRENRERQNTSIGGQPIGVTLTNAQPIPVRRNRRQGTAAAAATTSVPMRAPTAVPVTTTAAAAAAATGSSNEDGNDFLFVNNKCNARFTLFFFILDPLLTLTSDEYSIPVRIFGSQLPIRDLVHIAPHPAALNRIRVDLHAFVVRLFGSPLNESNMANVCVHLTNITLVVKDY